MRDGRSICNVCSWILFHGGCFFDAISLYYFLGAGLMTEGVLLDVILVHRDILALHLHVMQGLGLTTVLTTHLLPNENTQGMIKSDCSCKLYLR